MSMREKKKKLLKLEVVSPTFILDKLQRDDLSVVRSVGMLIDSRFSRRLVEITVVGDMLIFFGM